MDAELESAIAEFFAEAAENLSILEETIVALESNPDDAEMLATIFRNVHTIKGAAGTLGFDALTQFAHQVEDVLQRLRDGVLKITPELATLLLECVDAVRTLLSEAAAGIDALSEQQRALLEALNACAEGRSRGRTLPAAQGPSRRTLTEIGSSQSRSLRVDIEKLDKMLNLAGEITIYRSRLSDQLERLPYVAGLDSALETHREVDRLYMELQDFVMKLRMVRVGPTFRKFVRAVRDLAQLTGKHARLDIEGRDVEIDTRVIDQLKDPLMHMIRNAVDHGIESPAERKSAGKDPMGRVVLRASHEAGNVVIRVADDGRGIDPEAVLARSRALGLVAEGAKLAPSEIYAFLFEPGFSTRSEVTDISGRGVGLDVVRRQVELLRGDISVESRPGEGTTFTFRLPLTMAVIAGFNITVGGSTYVVPLDSVVECRSLPDDVRLHTGRGVMSLRGEALPLLDLRHYFAHTGEAPRERHIVIAHQGSGRIGLVADRLLGDSQTVVKPIGRLFKHVRGISASAIQGNGSVALILDVAALFGIAGMNSDTTADLPVSHEEQIAL